MTSYQLVLHDFDNLAVQLLRFSDDKSELQDEAERLNFLFNEAGKREQFFADVYSVHIPDGGE